MAAPQYGQDGEGNRTEVIEEGSTDPVEFLFDMRDQDSCGVVLATERQGRLIPIDVEDGDNVDGATMTWTLALGGFTAGDIGAVLRVNGSVSNDGTYTIASVTDEHTVVTGGSPTDEVFGADVAVFLIDDGVDPVAGVWTVEVINDYVPPATAGVYGQPVNPLPKCHPADITSQFSPAIAPVADVDDNQYVQAQLTGRAILFTFTPDGSGGGSASVFYFAKSWS